MTIFFLAISFLVQALCHALGNSLFLCKEYRQAEFRKEYQRGLVLPYSILGVSWIAIWWYNRTFEQQDTLYFCLLVVAVAIIPFILLVLNKRKTKR